jgi:hypothetical protein
MLSLPLSRQVREARRTLAPRPTVSPAKNALEYFLSIACIGHPVWRTHREEAKRSPFSGPRITRNGAAMVAWLLPSMSPGLSLIAGGCWISAPPRGQPRMPVLCTWRSLFRGRPVPRQLLRSAWLDVPTLVPATACHRRSYAERYSRFTRGTHNAVGPAQLMNRLITLHLVDEILDVDLHGWTPVRDRGRGCRQYTPSSNATTLESNKSVAAMVLRSAR